MKPNILQEISEKDQKSLIPLIMRRITQIRNALRITKIPAYRQAGV